MERWPRGAGASSDDVFDPGQARLRLADLPGVGAGQQGSQIALALPGAGLLQLRGHHLVVAGPRHVAEHPDRGVREVGTAEPRQGERIRRVGRRGVVHQQRVLVGPGHLGRLQRPVAAEAQPLALARAEPDRLAVLQPDQQVTTGRRVLYRPERLVVEDRAVLVDLDERRSPVIRRGPQHAGEVLAVGVDRAGHEPGLGADGERQRVERGVQRAERGRLRHLPLFGGGRVLALGQPVDPVVEQQDLDVDVPPERVDQMVAADRERVAVTGDHPYRQVGTGAGQAGGDRRRPAVDRVHPVAVHVVRQPG